MRNPNVVELPKDTDPKYLKLFTKDKSFYKTFFPLLLIIVLQQLAQLLVNMVDNVMLGRYTELALSGATIVNQIQFVLMMIASGIGMGVVVLSSQYWGQKRVEPIKKIISVGIKVSFLIGLIFFVLAITIPGPILTIFTNDAAIIAEGVSYLRIICFTYILFAVSNSLMFSLQSVETAGVGTIMAVSTIIINMILNYCFIYGNWGAPEMGIRGAAVATLVSRTVELIIILGYIKLIDKKLKLKIRELLKFDFTYLKDYIKISAPIAISGGLWGVAMCAQMVIIGHINGTVIAANSIAAAIAQLFSVIGFACANVAGVTTGKTIGEGKFDKIKSYSKTMQAIFVIIGILSGLLLFLFKDVIIGIYTVTPETKELAASFLLVLSATTIGTCYEYPVESGIIAGGGVTKYPAIVDNLFIWLFSIPTSFLSAFVFHFPPVVTFMFLKADQILKCIPNAIVVNRYRWVRKLTR